VRQGVVRVVRWVLVGAIAMTAACAALGRSAFVTPVVAFKDVRLKGVGLEGGSLDLILDVYNPNDYRLDASRVTYTLFVDTTQVATGVVSKRVTLENRKNVEVTLPVTFTGRELMGAAALLMRSGSLDYRVAGEVTVATPFGNFTRPYDGKGRFDSLRP
jgi:LEA14-like dessication related protein